MYFTSCIVGGSIIICLLIQCKKKAADRINSIGIIAGNFFLLEMEGQILAVFVMQLIPHQSQKGVWVGGIFG